MPRFFMFEFFEMPHFTYLILKLARDQFSKVKILKCYEKPVKGHFYGKFISNNTYKSLNNYFDDQGMNSRVNPRKVSKINKNRKL